MISTWLSCHTKHRTEQKTRDDYSPLLDEKRERETILTMWLQK